MSSKGGGRGGGLGESGMNESFCFVSWSLVKKLSLLFKRIKLFLSLLLKRIKLGIMKCAATFGYNQLHITNQLFLFGSGVGKAWSAKFVNIFSNFKKSLKFLKRIHAHILPPHIKVK